MPGWMEGSDLAHALSASHLDCLELADAGLRSVAHLELQINDSGGGMARYG